MKKILSLLILFSLVISLAACSSTTKEKSIYSHGLELIALIGEMAQSEDYLALYTASPEINEIISTAGQGDYSTPKAVYEITLAEDLLLAEAAPDAFEKLSAPLKNYIVSKTSFTLAPQINATGGAQILAASSICTAGKTFVISSFSGNKIYLYTFEHGSPAIVTFTAGEDHSVSASACFIFSEHFKADTLQEVSQYFEEIGAAVSEVNHK